MAIEDVLHERDKRRAAYVHMVVQRIVRSRDGREDQIVLKGTADQIAERVADSIKRRLNEGNGDVIRLEPIAPYNIFDLEKNP